MPTLPGPRESALGQLRHLRRDFLGYLLDAAQHGDLVQLRPAPGVSIVLVNHPALVREVLVTRAADFAKSRMTRKMVGKFLGQGLVLSEGETHHAQRRLLQPLFNSRRLVDCLPMLRAQADDFVAAHSGKTFDLEAAMTELALQGVLRVLFGAADYAQQSVSAAMRVFADSMAQRFRSLPLPDWLPTARHRRDRAAIAALDAAISELLRAADQGAAGDDVAATLAQAQRDGLVTASEIRDQLATLYFAGHETTAKLLTWTCVLLARHPDIAAALSRELQSIEPLNLDALPLLDQILNESLRLYPPAWVFDRETLADTELGGASLRKGQTVYLSPWVTHRDARWFDSPGEFRPERFAAGWEQRIDRHSYFPFGIGPRHCIGRGLAMLQAKVAISAFLFGHGLSIEGSELGEIAGKPGATLGLSRATAAKLTAIIP